MSSELQPRAEPLRRAITWISDRRRENPDARLADLVNEASLRFDLSPKDQVFLWEAFVSGEKK